MDGDLPHHVEVRLIVMSAQAHLIITVSLFAAAIVTMVRLRDWKFHVKPCPICGERDEHLVGCPGRRGY